MLQNDIYIIFERNLIKLKDEIHLYENPDDLWKLVPGISNSGGNLALHLVGNLRHFIGAVLGKSTYIRDRDTEFSAKNISVQELDSLIDTTVDEVKSALINLSPAELNMKFPKDMGGMKGETSLILLHLLAHFSYHLGQINYHRRILFSIGR